MKKADLVGAAVLAILSVYLMVKSMELPIGWLEGEGPGGGAFPFWLSAGMLICCVFIFIRNLRRKSPEGQSTEIFMDRESARLFLTVLVSLSVMIGLIHIVGIYISIPLFFIFYMRHLGKHPWPLVLAISLSAPVLTFVFFEKLLLILLPKGITDEWFYIFY
ncbi:MAG: tripartite tricarboxylate transporter TctB family protein [SAR324 cluster bacterium]|nr:tripartite tricarboxylate transporter TctB family protein [SAR324 cluster bacterium]